MKQFLLGFLCVLGASVVPIHAAEPALRVINRMQPEAAPDTERGWQLARGASVVERRGAGLRLPGGGFANAMTVASPGGAFRVELHASLGSEVSGSKAVAKLTIFLHRGRETRSLKETVRQLSSAEADVAEHAALVWVQDEGLSEGWKLGAQILAVDGTVLAHSATLLIEPLKKPEIIEGAFGRVEVDVMRPALTRLTLRRPNGALEPQSLLSDPQWPWFEQGGPEWANGAGTQVMDAEGRRYDSRQASPESVSVIENGIALNGITLRESSGSEPVAREDWQLRAERDTLLWTIHRTWLRPLEVGIDSTPGLFSSMRVLNHQFEADGKPLQAMPNATTTTLWVQPDQLEGRFHPAYRAAAQHDRRLISRHNLQWLARRDQWAIHKIFGSWENAVDLRLEPEGGHLMRRGCLGYLTEFGVAVHPRGGTSVVPGQSETVVLRLSPVDKKTTGHHLAVRLPDQELQVRLTSFYASLLNGGVINDQLSFNFGNETDGWFYAGNAWMHGHAIAAGVPAPGALSSDPMDAITAFRGHLASILGTAQADGRSAFGYNRRGSTLDDNLHAVRGMLIYTLCSGDRAFARQHIPLLERMLDIYLKRRNKDGLFDLGEDGNQYYDALRVSGISGYHNACFYKALRDMAALQRLAGSAQSAPRYDEIADEVKDAYNRLLWAEDAPGGPRYLDWISHTGERVHYCADISQFTPLAFGIASPEQAAKVLRTMDARIAELEKTHGYTGVSSLSAYWPAPIELMRHAATPFPST